MEPPQQKRCPNCGALSPQSTRFCPMCSYSFSSAAPLASGGQQQAPPHSHQAPHHTQQAPNVYINQPRGSSSAAQGCLTGVMAGGGIMAGCAITLCVGSVIALMLIGGCIRMVFPGVP